MQTRQVAARESGGKERTDEHGEDVMQNEQKGTQKRHAGLRMGQRHHEGHQHRHEQVDADGVGYDSLAVAMQFARHYRGRGGCRADEAEHGRLHDHAGRCLRKAPQQQTEAYEHEPLNE